MQRMRIALLNLFSLVAISATAQSQSLVFQSGAAQTALLELFTSEGCSSCPSAEQWLTNLKKSPRLWKEFVPVAFHVDYWDHLGWRDRWASQDFSNRQRAYAASSGSSSIYTPGFVLDGKEWLVWSHQQAGPRSSGAVTGVLRVSSVDWTNWQVSFAPAGQNLGGYEANAALLASDLTSDVKAGENRGHRLNHDFVATVLAKSLLKPASENAWGQLVLIPAAKSQAGHLALAVWVTRLGGLEPLQAVGGWLR
jgi:hypothetical protein